MEEERLAEVREEEKEKGSCYPEVRMRIEEGTRKVF